MRRLVAIALAVLALAAQRPPDESNVPDSEKRIPPGHYCQLTAVYQENAQRGRRSALAHPCDCKYACTVDEQGNVQDHEASNCLSYCHVNGRRCTCHPEGDPSVTCDKASGSAVMDMDGHVVSVARRR